MRSIRLGLATSLLVALTASCTVTLGEKDDGAGGGAAAGGSGGSAGGSARVEVDPSIGVDDGVLPAFDAGGPARRVATVITSAGNTMQLIENELLVATASPAQLEAFVERRGATVLGSYDLASAGDTSGVVYHAVRVNPAKATAGELESVLADVQGTPSKVTASSEAAVATLAVFASESKAGLAVFPNFVWQKDGVADRSTADAPAASGAHAADYTPNAFEWPYMRRGGALDIGVAEAWRVLEAHGKHTARVPVLILDAGFRNNDLPADTVLVGGTSWDQPNGGMCCNGTCACPWHGTGAARTVAGVPDNEFGAAGSGGPVARPFLLQSPRENFFDFLEYTFGLIAGVASAPIVSISASTTIDQWVCDVSGFFLGENGVCVLPHRLGASLRAANVLLVSSAGNNPARDLDSGDFTLPCEMTGTICVGGMNWSAPTLSGGSTRASKRAAGAIDIYAPFELWVGPDPADPTTNQATIFSGTSASAPFVAGVAALIKAANPSLSAGGIESVLLSSAHVGNSSQVHRWVNAYGAVRQAVGGDAPPFLRILQPIDGTSAPRLAAPMKFIADLEVPSGSASVTWSSNLDGPLGTGAEATYTGLLSFGTHVISATVTAAGLTHTATSSLTLTNTAPVATILAPAVGSQFYVSQAISLLGQSYDQNEAGTTLANSQVTWLLNGTPLGTGHARDIAPSSLSVGYHTLTFRVSDGTHTHDASRVVQVLSNPANLPPVIGVISPASGTNLGYADVLLGGKWVKQVNLSTTATDPDGPVLPDSAFTWKTTYSDGGSPVTLNLGTGKSILANLPGVCNSVQHLVTVTVTDGTTPVNKSVTYVVHTLC